MDVLDSILDTLALRGVVYFRSDFSGPWAVRVPPLVPAARFHLVLQGSCHIEIEDGPSLTLGPGDMVLVPRGRSHMLADRPGRRAAPLETVLQEAGFTGRGTLTIGKGDPEAATRTFCGHFAFRPMAAHPLIDALPPCILITAEQRRRHPWLDAVLDLLGQRALSADAGAEATLIRLSEVVFLETLRAGVSADPALSALVSGLADPQVGRAVAAIHADPAAGWSVASLVVEAGMSRSVFAERFAEVIGQPPMTYLAEWRMQRALALLEDRRLGVQQVAAGVGYASAAAFSRAFAGRFGLSPSAYRQGPDDADLGEVG
ncbi:MAG: AraC family transcriptional regulator [Pseudomonadota bacterium]